MEKKSYFLMYKQADLGEILFQGASKPITKYLRLESTEEKSAFAEGLIKWNKLCKDARISWDNATKKNNLIHERNAMWKKRGKLNRIKQVQTLPSLPEWKPFDPEFVVKMPLQ